MSTSSPRREWPGAGVPGDGAQRARVGGDGGGAGGAAGGRGVSRLEAVAALGCWFLIGGWLLPAHFLAPAWTEHFCVVGMDADRPGPFFWFDCAAGVIACEIIFVLLLVLLAAALFAGVAIPLWALWCLVRGDTRRGTA